MALRNFGRIFHRKIKGFKIRRFLSGNMRRRATSGSRREHMEDLWVTHGSYHDGDEYEESIVVQREQTQDDCELWFFGVFDDGRIIGDGVTKYMQSHFFLNLPKQSRLGKQSKQAMKKALLNARAKMLTNREKTSPDSSNTGSSESGSCLVMVIGGEKLVTATMGDYSTVLCRDGEAYQICGGDNKKNMNTTATTTTTQWSLKQLISGVLRIPKLQKISDKPSVGSGAKISRSRSLEIDVGCERLDSEAEFVILASSGIWEVMGQQEAVNLIRHIEDPKEAAKSLATEALTRMTKSSISCLIIRFD